MDLDFFLPKNKTEKGGQEKSGSQHVKESGTREENQRKYAEAGQRHLAGGERGRAAVHDGRHDRIRLVGAALEQLQREKCVHRAHDHDAGGQKEQPGVMPVREYRLGVRVPAHGMPSRSHETETNGPPGKFPSILFHPRLWSVLVCQTVQWCSPAGVEHWTILSHARF